jgi:sortase A
MEPRTTHGRPTPRNSAADRHAYSRPHANDRLARSAGEGSRTRALARRRGLVGRVEVPRLGIRAVIAEGTSRRVLSHAVGHVRWTPLPGEPGNVALTAHRDSYFRPLADVKRGDLVRVVTPDGTFRYRVTRTQVVPRRRVSVLRQDRGSGLTLVTCYPFRWIGPAPKRFVVTAVPEPATELRAAR